MGQITRISAPLNANGNPQVYPLLDSQHPVPENYPDITAFGGTLSMGLGITATLRISGNVGTGNTMDPSSILVTFADSGNENIIDYELVSVVSSGTNGDYTIEINLLPLEIGRNHTLAVTANMSEPVPNTGLGEDTTTIQYEVLGEQGDTTSALELGSTFDITPCNKEMRIGATYDTSSDTWVQTGTVLNIRAYTDNPDLIGLGRKIYTLQRPCKVEDFTVQMPETSVYVMPCAELCVGNGHVLDGRWQYVQEERVEVEGGDCGCDTPSTIASEVVLLEILLNASSPFSIRRYTPYGQIRMVNPSALCVDDCSHVNDGDTVLFNIQDTLIVNNPGANQTLSEGVKWELTHPDGTITSFTPSTGFAQDLTLGKEGEPGSPSMTYNQIGEYKLTATITNDCCSYITDTFYFRVGDGVSYTQGCGELVIKNCSGNNWVVDLFLVDGTQLVYNATNNEYTIPVYNEDNIVTASFTGTIVEEQVTVYQDLNQDGDYLDTGEAVEQPMALRLNAGSSVTLKWPLEGAYVVRLSRYTREEGSDTVITRKFHVVLDICNIEECMRKLINDIRCNKLDNCEDPEFEIRKSMILISMYFELLNRKNEVFKNNDIYTSTSEISAALSDVDQLIKHLNNYCGDCGPAAKSILNCGCN